MKKMNNNEKNEKKEKNEKNEKMKKRKNEKMKKNDEIWIHTQNPRRFPGFTVVVETFFFKILDDFHDFVSDCVSFPRKINNPFCGVSVFPKKVTSFIGRETKTHILPTKINNKKSIRSALLSIIILLE